MRRIVVRCKPMTAPFISMIVRKRNWRRKSASGEFLMMSGRKKSSNRIPETVDLSYYICSPFVLTRSPLRRCIRGGNRLDDPVRHYIHGGNLSNQTVGSFRILILILADMKKMNISLECTYVSSN